MQHIEVIQSREKIDGYLPPSEPSSIETLTADLEKAKTMTSLGVSVWKVLRQSDKYPRRLTLPNGRYLACRVIGGVGYEDAKGYWLFVSVSVADGLKALTNGSE
jgi:hypothetical protein